MTINLTDYRADAEAMIAKRDAATAPPWEARYENPQDIVAGNKFIRIIPPFGWGAFTEESQREIIADADFIRAARSDPSPERVIELCGEVERLTRENAELTERLKRWVPRPETLAGFHEDSDVWYLMKVAGQDRTAQAQSVIDACLTWGVDVPPHLKDFL